MNKLLKLFKDGGISKTNDIQYPSWLKVRETVRSEILSLPRAIDRTRKRRAKLDSNLRLFSGEMLNELEQ